MGIEGKTTWEIRAEKRIEEVLNQPNPSTGDIFCEGNVEYCVYYPVSNCPRTCAYAREKELNEGDQRTKQASG